MKRIREQTDFPITSPRKDSDWLDEEVTLEESAPMLKRMRYYQANFLMQFGRILLVSRMFPS